MTHQAVPYVPQSHLAEHTGEIKEILAEHVTWAVRDGTLQHYFARSVPKTARVLDVGTGPGTFLQQLMVDGYTHLAGLDIEDFLLDELKGKIEFVKADLDFDTIPLTDGSVDVAVAMEVFEHLENPFHFIREMHRILSPNGLLVLSTPNPFHIWNRLKFLLKGNLQHWHLHNDHISFLTKDVFTKTVLPYFSVESVLYRPGYLPYFPKVNMPRTEFWGRSVCYFLRRKI